MEARIPQQVLKVKCIDFIVIEIYWLNVSKLKSIEANAQNGNMEPPENTALCSIFVHSSIYKSWMG